MGVATLLLETLSAANEGLCDGDRDVTDLRMLTVLVDNTAG